MDSWTSERDVFPTQQQLCRYTDDKEKFLHILILRRAPND